MSEQTRPAASVAAVTTSDTADLTKLNTYYPRALYVGVGGDVKVMTPDGQSATLKNAASGAILTVQVRRVYATGTTATDIVALY